MSENEMNAPLIAEFYLYCNMIPFPREYSMVRFYIEGKIKEYEKKLLLCRQIKITDRIKYYPNNAEEIMIDILILHFYSKLDKLKE